MARVAIVHPRFSLSGGAEAVALNILEALERDHTLTLLTSSSVDLNWLNEYHGTEVSDVRIQRPRMFDGINAVVGERFELLKYAILNRYLLHHEDDYDLIISSFNELNSSNPCICYFHHPVYDRSGLEHDVRTTSTVRKLYKRIAAEIAGVSSESLGSKVHLANSDWTASIVEEIYETRPETVYPPVNVTEFATDRDEGVESGFVSIGRIAPDKNTLRNIEIVRRLRNRGHDVHLHLVGPVQRSGYLEQVREFADDSFVSIEGAMSRAELIEMVHTHRYGLHGKEFEHFGIVIAEMIAGGMLPFLPATGGQTEIVGGNRRLTYHSLEDAVETADRVLSDDDLENTLRDELADVPGRFERERFQRRISEIVERTIA